MVSNLHAMIPLETPVTGDRFNSGLLQTIHLIRGQHGMDPVHFVFWSLTCLRQQRKARERARARKAGLEIPSLLILNLAYLCNLQRNSCSMASGETRFLDISSAERAGALIREAQKENVTSRMDLCRGFGRAFLFLLPVIPGCK